MPQSSDRKPSLTSRVVRRVILWLYRWKGWTIDGRMPDLDKFIIAGAPHASNWDFVFFVGATAKEGRTASFMGKHTLFRGFMRNFMLDMGGIPVDRSRKAKFVEQVAAEFRMRERLVLVIAAEGSRTSDGTWKSGFYHIARAANVPIVPAYVDNETNTLGFGPPIVATQSYGETLAEIARYLRGKLPDFERYKTVEAQATALIAEERRTGERANDNRISSREDYGTSRPIG